MLVVPGWALSDHPWPEVRSPERVPIFVWAAVLVLAVWTFLMSGQRWRLPQWAARLVAIAAILRFAAWALPLHYAQRYVADNTEALELGASALWHLRDPYLLTTTIGNPIGPLLGGLVLAMPLTRIMGNLDLQNLIWLCAGAWLLDRRHGARAAAAFVVILLVSPWARATLPYANDNGITSAGIVVIGTWGWVWAARRPERPWWQVAVWAFAFSCALIYRYTMWGVVVPLLALFVRRLGWRTSLRWFAPVAGFSAFLLLLPLVQHPEAYLNGPWRATAKSADSGLGATVVLLTLVLVSVALTAWRARTLAMVWGGYAIALSLVLTTMAAYSLPTLGLRGALAQYEVSWYIGWVLVFGLAALVTGSRSLAPAPLEGVGDRPATAGPGGQMRSAAQPGRIENVSHPS